MKKLNMGAGNKKRDQFESGHYNLSNQNKSLETPSKNSLDRNSYLSFKKNQHNRILENAK